MALCYKHMNDPSKTIYFATQALNIATDKVRDRKIRIKAFMRAAGIDVDNVPLNNQTLSQAMNTPVEANIGTKPGSNGHPPKNNVKSFLAANTAPAAPAPQQAQAAAPQQAQAPAPQANQPTGQQVNWQE